jgi:AmmeMemoRadiSam system protein B
VAAFHLPAAHAGSAYPDDAAQLRDLLHGALQAAPAIACPDGLPMLVAPHIDLRVDTATHAAAYRALLSRPAFPETIFILGVGHRCPHEFSLAPASFTTPLGRAAPDPDAIAQITASLDFETARGLEGWPGEHSLEFALVWLQALRDLAFPGARFRIVPVLLGGLWPHVLSGRPAGPRTHIHRFGHALLTAARACPDAAILASIDGCHVGPRFDHPFSGAQAREGVQRWEKQLWSLCSSATHTEWFAHIAALRNEAYFDGVGVLDLLLRHDPRHARVLKHRLWFEPRDQSFVTFTAAVLNSESGQS